jgi:hypothetical protein
MRFDREVSGVSEDKLSANLSYKIISGFTAGVTFNWSGKYFADDINSPVPGSDPDISDYINDAYVTADLQFTNEQPLKYGNLNVYFCI